MTRLISRFSTLSCAGFLLASCGDQTQETSNSDVNLINGTLSGTKGSEVLRVASKDTRFTTPYNCTMTRIGPRHFLGAGHCINWINKTPTDPVTGKPLDKTYTKYPITVYYGQNSTALGSYPLDLRLTSVINEAPNQYIAPTTNDIAVYVIKPGNTTWGASPKPDESYIKAFDTALIPKAVISTAAVTVGKAVTLYGYGCYNTSGSQDYEKRYGNNTVSAFAPTGLLTNFVTPGNTKPTGCEGDSGGPVFAGTATNYSVVGILSDRPAGNYSETWHARIDGARGNWITKRLETPILDSHNTKVFKNLASFKVYGYKLNAPGDGGALPVLKFKYGSTTTTLTINMVGCPTPTVGEAPFVCFSTTGLATVPVNTVGTFTISRKFKIGTTVSTLESAGRTNVRVCHTTQTCTEPL